MQQNAFALYAKKNLVLLIKNAKKYFLCVTPLVFSRKISSIFSLLYYIDKYLFYVFMRFLIFDEKKILCYEITKNIKKSSFLISGLFSFFLKKSKIDENKSHIGLILLI